MAVLRSFGTGFNYSRADGYKAPNFPPSPADAR